MELLAPTQKGDIMKHGGQSTDNDIPYFLSIGFSYGSKIVYRR
jgi:hypothetical protein